MCELGSAQASSPLCTLCQQLSTISTVNLAQPHPTRFAAVLSSQFKHMPIFLFDRQKQRITSCIFLCRMVLSWDCTAAPPSTVQSGTVPATDCISCGLCLSAWLNKSGTAPGWHDHMASDQGVCSITDIRYFSWAAQTSFQYAIYLRLLLARCWAQTGILIPLCCSVVHQCD